MDSADSDIRCRTLPVTTGLIASGYFWPRAPIFFLQIFYFLSSGFFYASIHSTYSPLALGIIKKMALGRFLRNLRKSVPVETYPLIVATGFVSALGIGVLIHKAGRSPDVWWSRPEEVPWDVTLEQREHMDHERTHKHWVIDRARPKRIRLTTTSSRSIDPAVYEQGTSDFGHNYRSVLQLCMGQNGYCIFYAQKITQINGGNINDLCYDDTQDLL